MPIPVLLTSYQYVLACTSIYQYIQVHKSTYQYIPVCTGMCCYILWNFGRGKPRLGGLTVKESLRRLPCARKLCERTKPIVLLRLVGAGGRTERDPMKCAGWFPSVPVRTSMYQYVLVCTMNRLNLSSF
jgi:hypothetical protein